MIWERGLNRINYSGFNFELQFAALTKIIIKCIYRRLKNLQIRWLKRQWECYNWEWWNEKSEHSYYVLSCNTCIIPILILSNARKKRGKQARDEKMAQKERKKKRANLKIVYSYRKNARNQNKLPWHTQSLSHTRKDNEGCEFHVRIFP